MTLNKAQGFGGIYKKKKKKGYVLYRKHKNVYIVVQQILLFKSSF